MDDNHDDNENNTTGNPSTFLNLSLSHSHTGGATSGAVGDVSPLEQDVLDEYARLARNMKTVGDSFFSPLNLPRDTSRACVRVV